MTRKIFILLLLAFCLNIFADKIDDVIKSVPGNDKYPNASAINVLTEIDLEVEDDFSYTYHVFYVKKILNYKGSRRYSDVKISYNADFEQIELGHCFSIDTEGNRIEIPENQIYDMNDTESIQSPDYKNFREKIINFPKIEPGYFVVLDYTISNNRCEPVSGVEHLRESNPYLTKTFTLKFPKDKALNSFYDKEIVTFTRSSEGNDNIYSWQVIDAKIYKEEDNSPSLLISGTPIVYSFYKDWHELASYKLAKLKNIEVDPEISEMGKSLTKDCQNDNEKVLVIYKFMAENFNEKEAYTSQFDFTPEPLTEVWQKKFGSERELTALFIALLNSAGIADAYPAIILSSNNKFSEIQKKYAVTDFMDKLCVYWHDQLFSAGNSYMPFAYANISEANILIGNDNYEFIKFSGKNSVIENQVYNYNISGTSAVVDVKSTYSAGKNKEKREWYLNMPDAQRKIWFNRSLGVRSASLIEGPEFLNFDKIDEDLEITYTLEYEDFLVNQPPYKYCKLIAADFSLDVSLDDRENDYQVKDKIFLKQKFNIEFDMKMNEENKILLLNETQDIIEFKINDKTAYFKLEAKLADSKIIVNKEIYIPECIIPNSRYQEFKQFILSIQNPIDNMVFMK